MRPRLSLIAAAVAAFVAFTSASAQEPTSDRWADALTPGNYVRLGYGVVNPISPEGSLRDWNRGAGISVGFENWAVGGQSGVSRLGFGIEAGYSLFPFNEQQFLVDFPTSPNGQPLSAKGNKAAIFQVALTTRLRIPMMYIMPNIGLGLGFLDWRPGKINYSATAGAGTVTQQHRSGAALTLSGGFDKHVVDRFALFADASYTYAYTSFGGSLAASGSSCLVSNCDLLKNTQLGTVRGGLRVRVGR